jgi:hypothetical protein
VVTAAVFARPDTYIGKSLNLVADVKSLAECRAIRLDVKGKPPATFPMPIRLFDRFTRGDVTAMWRWLKTGNVPMDTAETHAIHPDALTVREWMAANETNDPKRGLIMKAKVERLETLLLDLDNAVGWATEDLCVLSGR